MIDVIESRQTARDRCARSSAAVRASCIVGPVEGVQGRGFLLGLKTKPKAAAVRDALLAKRHLDGNERGPARAASLAAVDTDRRARAAPGGRFGGPDRCDALTTSPISRATRSRISSRSRSASTTKPEPRALEGKVLSLLFLSPSLRTLSSFQAAMIRMGGGVVRDLARHVDPRARVALRHRNGRRGGRARARSDSRDRVVRRRDGRARVRRAPRSRRTTSPTRTSRRSRR